MKEQPKPAKWWEHVIGFTIAGTACLGISLVIIKTAAKIMSIWLP
jgi:hypothetical protein